MASERDSYNRVSVKVRHPDGERFMVFEPPEINGPAVFASRVRDFIECRCRELLVAEQSASEPFDDGPAAKVLAVIGIKPGDRVNFEWPDGATSRATVTAARNDYIIFDDERAVNRKHILALWPAKAKEEDDGKRE